MKKIALAFLVTLMIGGCGLIPPLTNPTPTIDIQGTNVANTQAAPTLTATAQPTETFTPTVEEPPLNPTITPVLFPSQDLTLTPATATSESIAPTSTAPATVVSGVATLTPTLGVLTYGTLPPAVPFNSVTLRNRSKAQAYISLQQQNENGAILEYPVKSSITIQAPIGSYIYVAWVGGKKMTGSFKLNANSEVFIIIYKDKIVIQHI